MQQAREEGGRREERPNRNQQEIDPKRQGERPEVLGMGMLLPFPSFVVVLSLSISACLTLTISLSLSERPPGISPC